ncbi:MAG: hypothetical protein ABL955_00955 [Elusimicrobiota bacterium]
MIDERSFASWLKGILTEPSPGRTPRLDKATRLAFVDKLFSEFEKHMATQPPAKVADALERLIDAGQSDTMFLLFDANVPLDARVHAIGSLAGVVRYLQRHCASSPDLTNLCEEWWDRFPAHPDPADAARHEIDMAILSFFSQTLKSDSSLIQKFALHGLGHWQHAYSKEVGLAIADFIAARPDIDADIRKYAEAAREGLVL